MLSRAARLATKKSPRPSGRQVQVKKVEKKSAVAKTTDAQEISAPAKKSGLSKKSGPSRQPSTDKADTPEDDQPGPSGPWVG